MSDSQPKLISLLDRMYDETVHHYEYGLSYFNVFLPELEQYSFIDLFVCLSQQTRFGLYYSLGLILSIPSLWINLSDTDWIGVMSALNPRQHYIPNTKEIYNCGYLDIHFLCKYLEVDAINCFLRQNFSKEDKKRMLQYSNKIAFDLFKDELDEEDLDGEYYIHKDKLKNLGSQLIDRGQFKSFNYTVNEIKKYIELNLENIDC